MFLEKQQLPELQSIVPICMSCRTCVGWSPRGTDEQGVCSKLTVVTHEGVCSRGLITPGEHGCQHWDSRVATLN